MVRPFLSPTALPPAPLSTPQLSPIQHQWASLSNCTASPQRTEDNCPSTTAKQEPPKGILQRVFTQMQGSQKPTLGMYRNDPHRGTGDLPVGLAGGFALAMSLSTIAAAGVLAALLGLMTVPRRVVPSTFTAGAKGAGVGVAAGAASSTLCPLACSHSSAVHALDSGSFHTCNGVKTD